MAEEKKFDKKPILAPVAKKWHPVEIIIVLLLITAVLGSIFNSLNNYLVGNQLSFFGIPFWSFKDFFVGNSFIFKLISIVVSLGALAGVIILSDLRRAILIAEKAKLFPMGNSVSGVSIPEEDTTLKKKWIKILEQSESTSESDWRIAIIEADIILEELLSKLNLSGDTIGDKLKAVEKSDFTTLDSAWEAHKTRNQIAHGGSDFLLNQRETRRVISLYGIVFKEFYLI